MFTGCHRTPRWLLLCLACNQPIHPNPFSVDQKPSAGRADVDLPAAGGQTGQQVGSARRDLEKRPGDGGLGWLGRLGLLAAGCWAAGLRCPPQLAQARARAAATGMLAGQPLEPPNPIFHRLLLWDDRPAHDSVTKCPVASSQSPGGHPVTGPSAVSSLLAAKLLVHCQMPTSPLTGQSWLLFLET